jgi:hypothetical protein
LRRIEQAIKSPAQMLLKISWVFIVMAQSTFAGMQTAIFARGFVAFCNELKYAQKQF